MIGVIVPAHNEARLIGKALLAIRRAASDPALLGERVHIVVAADACTDQTAIIARPLADDVIEIEERSVGAARAVACTRALSLGCRWIASTDADSRVPPDWLSAQLSYECDVVCGTVQLGTSRWLPPALRRRYAEAYFAIDGHRHIHGANLGVAADAYVRAGGFPTLAAHEDVALVEALGRVHARIAWRARPCVTTSARIGARAPSGFAAHLQALHREHRATCSSSEQSGFHPN